ncbi:MAG TPA: hypothetical protein VIH37_00055 [Candidatus Limnocylindrales bacterium]
MPKGGARIKSGPPPDPTSERSERRGYRLDRLPAAGYDGPVPDFPLPGASERELEVWQREWRTPQACAWSMPTEHWRWPKIAWWVRLTVRCEAPDAPATLVAPLLRIADDIGMTTAGLAAMGWTIVADLEVAPEPQAQPEDEEPAPRRLSAVNA